MTVGGGRLREYLDGLDYPVSREDLVRRAQENGAGTETLQALRALPVEEFGSATELTEAIGPLPG
ncbi:DUF2795 domain-containing protein [Micromonospora sp. WMMD882]|uniref:DUF2795 domain-containing protein n=1 Tax=Micromonospora sp. WMMD882 TaxID=3015151 RepID=UPI00248AD998|nr:DUF2795 domain-containing protein [Micromonospora sp. WMMD882]WBB79444.1 DUF2795 domain-containing protein [Micromonospora sp. WMMD882]